MLNPFFPQLYFHFAYYHFCESYIWNFLCVFIFWRKVNSFLFCICCVSDLKEAKSVSCCKTPVALASAAVLVTSANRSSYCEFSLWSFCTWDSKVWITPDFEVQSSQPLESVCWPLFFVCFSTDAITGNYKKNHYIPGVAWKFLHSNYIFYFENWFTKINKNRKIF